MTRDELHSAVWAAYAGGDDSTDLLRYQFAPVFFDERDAHKPRFSMRALIGWAIDHGYFDVA